MNRKKILYVLLLVTLALSSTGCLRKFKLNLSAGPCLNPPDLYCNEDGSGSRPLEVRVYQLKTWIDAETLNWEDLLDEDAAFDLLRSYMSDPENKAMVQTKFTIENNEEKVHKFYRVKGTKYLLTMTAGRNKGKQSLLILPLTWTQRSEELYLEYYDVKSKSKLRDAIGEPNKPISAP